MGKRYLKKLNVYYAFNWLTLRTVVSSFFLYRHLRTIKTVIKQKHYFNPKISKRSSDFVRLLDLYIETGKNEYQCNYAGKQE